MAVFSVIFGGTVSASAQSPDLEYEIKAAFLFNFSRFVTWPEEAFPSPDAPFVIGVLAPQNPFNNVLNEAVRNKNVEGRAVEARHGRTLEELGSVQILFISRTPPAEIPGILQELGSSPILTVGEIPEFTASGGMIRFFLREGRIALEINREAADQAGLRISSRLLALAVIFREDGAER